MTPDDAPMPDSLQQSPIQSPPAVEPCEFVSRGIRCAADLYRPAGVERPPVVVMAHGFAAERSFGLPEFARRFAQAGLAVLLFDYPGFGGSDGRPRHVVSYRRQRKDWKAAVQYARTIDGIDPSKIALWGSSYSGGHVIVTAATVPGIAAIVAQVPAVDVPKSSRILGAGFVFRAVMHAGWDLLRSLLFLSPHYVPVFGPPERFAMLNRPGCEEGYRRLVPEGSAWQNRCAAREMLLSLMNRPVRFAGRVACPALVVVALQDQLLPPRTATKAAALMPHATVVNSAGDHFAPYFGEEFERLVAVQTEFLRRHLLDAGA